MTKRAVVLIISAIITLVGSLAISFFFAIQADHATLNSTVRGWYEFMTFFSVAIGCLVVCGIGGCAL